MKPSRLPLPVLMTASHCPVSHGGGRPVEFRTVQALLRPAALARVKPGPHALCDDPACEVVYFDADGSTYSARDLTVRVGFKAAGRGGPVCYCFDETEDRIRDEIRSTGRTEAVERVRGHIAAGRCACDVRNPKGVCCLGELTAAVKRAHARVEAEAAGLPVDTAPPAEPIRFDAGARQHDRVWSTGRFPR